MSDKWNALGLISVALLLLLLPLQWLGAVIIAGLIHELGHYSAVRLLGGTVHSLKLGSSGAVMEASGLTPYSELISLAAGPLTGLLSVFLIRTFPAIAICGIIQSAYNLLPIYPLDGGKILYRIILMLGGTQRCFRIIELSVVIILFLLCIHIWLRYRVSLFLLLIISLFRKTPCKPLENSI